MNRVRYLCVMILCIALVGGALSWTHHFDAFMSFETGFVGFASVVISSFVAILRHVQMDTQADSKNTQNPESTQKSASKSQAQKHSRFVVGTRISFSLFRLLSYVCFTGALVSLMHYGKFHLWSFLIGIAVAISFTIGMGVYMFSAKHFGG